jgi:hypothetical protein
MPSEAQAQALLRQLETKTGGHKGRCHFHSVPWAMKHCNQHCTHFSNRSSVLPETKFCQYILCIRDITYTAFFPLSFFILIFLVCFVSVGNQRTRITKDRWQGLRLDSPQRQSQVPHFADKWSEFWKWDRGLEFKSHPACCSWDWGPALALYWPLGQLLRSLRVLGAVSKKYKGQHCWVHGGTAGGVGIVMLSSPSEGPSSQGSI